MSKIKIILSTTALIGLAGGTLALHTKKLQGLTIYTLRDGDFIPKANPNENQNCLQTLCNDGGFVPANANASYYYITSSVPVNGLNECHYQYYTCSE